MCGGGGGGGAAACEQCHQLLLQGEEPRLSASLQGREGRERGGQRHNGGCELLGGGGEGVAMGEAGERRGQAGSEIKADRWARQCGHVSTGRSETFQLWQEIPNQLSPLLCLFSAPLIDPVIEKDNKATKTQHSCKKKGGGWRALERVSKIIQIARTGVAVTCCPGVPPSWENHSISCFSGFHKSQLSAVQLSSQPPPPPLHHTESLTFLGFQSHSARRFS